MTTIVAYRDKRDAWIAGDSSMHDSDSVIIATDPKVWKPKGRSAEWLVGFSGGAYLGEVARRSGLGDPYELRDYVADFWLTLGGVFGENDTGFLCVNQTGIYMIDAYFSIIRSRENYAAIGSGGAIALGALFALRNVIIEPRDRLKTSLEASMQHSREARKPFRYMSLPREKG